MDTMYPVFSIMPVLLSIWGLIRIYYHFLQDQYLALCLGPGLLQLCLALNDLRALGLFFLMRMVFCPAFFAEVPPWPKFTLTTLPFGFLTYTLNFLTSPRIGFPSLTFRPWYSASLISGLYSRINSMNSFMS